MMMLATLLAAAAAPAPTDALVWTDLSGKNTLTWSRDGAITVDHRVVSSGKHYWYRQLSVAPPECIGSDHAFAMSDTVTVTDADSDGIDEVSFAIRSGCTADGSAVSLSVYLWEDGAMHQLWSETAGSAPDGIRTTTAPKLSASLDDNPALASAILDRFTADIESDPILLSAPIVLHRTSSRQ